MYIREQFIYQLRMLEYRMNMYLRKYPLLASLVFYLKNWDTTGSIGLLTLVAVILLSLLLILLLGKVLLAAAIIGGAVFLVRLLRSGPWGTRQQRAGLSALCMILAVVLSCAVLLEKPYSPGASFTYQSQSGGESSGSSGSSGSRRDYIDCFFCDKSGVCSTCHGVGVPSWNKGRPCPGCHGTCRCFACDGAGYLPWNQKKEQ